MGFDFLLATLLTNALPPLGTALHKQKGDVFYAPISHEGVIYTIDDEIWKAQGLRNTDDLKYLFPPAYAYSENPASAMANKSIALAALAEFSLFHPFGSESPVELQKLSKKTTLFSEKGFDVIDASGLSALTNIGYSKSEFDEIERLNIKTNENGLIENASDAYKFAAMASDICIEHAPFFPVRIVMLSSEKENLRRVFAE